jgi:hypothetical protein
MMGALVLLLLSATHAFQGSCRSAQGARTGRTLDMNMLKVGLTRELGANDKLLALLGGVECFEVPCIMFDTGEDIDKLQAAIIAHDIITITSPQAAAVFLSAWETVGKPEVKLVTVGMSV